MHVAYEKLEGSGLPELLVQFYIELFVLQCVS